MIESTIINFNCPKCNTLITGVVNKFKCPICNFIVDLSLLHQDYIASISNIKDKRIERRAN